MFNVLLTIYLASCLGTHMVIQVFPVLVAISGRDQAELKDHTKAWAITRFIFTFAPILNTLLAVSIPLALGSFRGTWTASLIKEE